MRRRLLWIFFLPALIWAQSYTASIRGIVTDATQAAVPAATITVTDVDRNLKRTTAVG